MSQEFHPHPISGGLHPSQPVIFQPQPSYAKRIDSNYTHDWATSILHGDSPPAQQLVKGAWWALRASVSLAEAAQASQPAMSGELFADMYQACMRSAQMCGPASATAQAFAWLTGYTWDFHGGSGSSIDGPSPCLHAQAFPASPVLNAGSRGAEHAGAGDAVGVLEPVPASLPASAAKGSTTRASLLVDTRPSFPFCMLDVLQLQAMAHAACHSTWKRHSTAASLAELAEFTQSRVHDATASWQAPEQWGEVLHSCMLCVGCHVPRACAQGVRDAAKHLPPAAVMALRMADVGSAIFFTCVTAAGLLLAADGTASTRNMKDSRDGTANNAARHLLHWAANATSRYAQAASAHGQPWVALLNDAAKILADAASSWGSVVWRWAAIRAVAAMVHPSNDSSPDSHSTGSAADMPQEHSLWPHVRAALAVLLTAPTPHPAARQFSAPLQASIAQAALHEAALSPQARAAAALVCLPPEAATRAVVCIAGCGAVAGDLRVLPLTGLVPQWGALTSHSCHGLPIPPSDSVPPASLSPGILAVQRWLDVAEGDVVTAASLTAGVDPWTTQITEAEVLREWLLCARDTLQEAGLNIARALLDARRSVLVYRFATARNQDVSILAQPLYKQAALISTELGASAAAQGGGVLHERRLSLRASRSTFAELLNAGVAGGTGPRTGVSIAGPMTTKAHRRHPRMPTMPRAMAGAINPHRRTVSMATPTASGAGLLDSPGKGRFASADAAGSAEPAWVEVARQAALATIPEADRHAARLALYGQARGSRDVPELTASVPAEHSVRWGPGPPPRDPLAHAAGSATGSAGMQWTPQLLLGTETLTCWPSVVPVCQNCSRPLTPRSLAGEVLLDFKILHGIGPSLRACPLCAAPLPRCALSLLRLSVPNPLALQPKPQQVAARKAQERGLHSPELRAMDAMLVPSPPLPHMHRAAKPARPPLAGGAQAMLPQSGWVSCLRCGHGGYEHAIHDWFSLHTVCAVSGCMCHCTQIDRASRKPVVDKPVP